MVSPAPATHPESKIVYTSAPAKVSIISAAGEDLSTKEACIILAQDYFSIAPVVSAKTKEPQRFSYESVSAYGVCKESEGQSVLMVSFAEDEKQTLPQRLEVTFPAPQPAKDLLKAFSDCSRVHQEPQSEFAENEEDVLVHMQGEIPVPEEPMEKDEDEEKYADADQ